MSANVVVFREPRFKPLPGELTPSLIREATLPVKVEAAKRAIAACCDLSELLTWKDKLAALAAAAKMARMPEMARDVNRVHKEAIFRMGEILLQYNAESIVMSGAGSKRSERREAAEAAGVPKNTAIRAARLASAPREIRERLLADDKIPASAASMTTPRWVPRSNSVRSTKLAQNSDAANLFFRGINEDGHRKNAGLNSAVSIMRALPLDLARELTPEEKQRARKLVVEMQELLDEVDRRLGAP